MEDTEQKNEERRYHLRIRVWEGIEGAVDTETKRTYIRDSGMVITQVPVGIERYLLVTIPHITPQALEDLDAIFFQSDKKYSSIADTGLLYALVCSDDEVKSPRELLRQYSSSADIGGRLLVKLPYENYSVHKRTRSGLRSLGFEVVDERLCTSKACSYMLNRVPLEETVTGPKP